MSGRKADISIKRLPPWDQFKSKTPEDAVAAIYTQVDEASAAMRSWYWRSIRTKRVTSQLTRGFAFAFLMIGTIAPVLAATLREDSAKLCVTQWAVAFLAIAGLLVLADRIFGWSSGWMRYITTVTAMENLTGAFQLEWGKFLLSKAGGLDREDAKSLFDLARSLEDELVKLQSEETTKWVAEFNTSISLLEGMIKTQREETDKRIAEIRTTLASKEQTAKEAAKGNLSGAIEVTIAHEHGSKKVRLALDEEPFQEFLGSVWSKSGVAPGLHTVRLQTISEPQISTAKIVEVSPAAVAHVEIKPPI